MLIGKPQHAKNDAFLLETAGWDSRSGSISHANMRGTGSASASHLSTPGSTLTRDCRARSKSTPEAYYLQNDVVPKILSEQVLHDLEPVDGRPGEPLLHSLEEEKEGGR